MIDFKGVSNPLISLGIFEVRVSILARSCSDVKQFSLVLLLCGVACAALVLSDPRANTHRPAYVLALRTCVRTPSIRSVRGGNGQLPSRWLPLALQLPPPGTSGSNLPASVLDKRWQICYNILRQNRWHLAWQIGWHLVRQSACRISSVYFRHLPHSDIHV